MFHLLTFLGTITICTGIISKGREMGLVINRKVASISTRNQKPTKQLTPRARNVVDGSVTLFNSSNGYTENPGLP